MKEEKNLGANESPKPAGLPAVPVRKGTYVCCHAVFIICLVGLIGVGVIFNSPLLIALAVLVAAIYYFLISSVVNAAEYLMRSAAPHFLLILGLGLMLVSAVFPPWCDNREALGYSFLFGARHSHFYWNDGDEHARIDFARLVSEWVAIAAFTGILWLLTARPKTDRRDTTENQK